MAHTFAYITSFEEGAIYHIFNRAISNELLFREERNYKFFLQRYGYYLKELVDTIAYCLLPNHFHFCVLVKNNQEAHRNFSKLFQSYALSFNRTYHRKGSLFDRPFKRERVENDAYVSRLIRFIHQNPQLHGIIEDFSMRAHSSNKECFHKTGNSILSDYVQNWFMSEGEYLAYHNGLERLGKMD